MPVAIEVTPEEPVATRSATRIDVTGTDANDLAAFDAETYPTSPEKRYYLAFEVGGEEVGRSQVFGTSPDGAFTFNSYIFPSAGAYTVNLRDVEDDSSVATQAVTVTAP